MSLLHGCLKCKLISCVCCLQRMDPTSDCTLGKGKMHPAGTSEYPLEGVLYLWRGPGKCQVDGVGTAFWQGLASDQSFLGSWSSPNSWSCSFSAIAHDSCVQEGLRESSLQSPRETGPSMSCVPTSPLPCPPAYPGNERGNKEGRVSTFQAEMKIYSLL